MTPSVKGDNEYWIYECGICEKPITSNTDAAVWPSLRSRLAHRFCFMKIKDSQIELIKEILQLFESMPMNEVEKAHVRSICAVRRACKMSLLNFIEKNGPEALKNIFNTVGKAEAIRASKL